MKTMIWCADYDRRQCANEPVVYRLAQTIYDFLDEKFVFLNDEKRDHGAQGSSTA